MSCHKQYIYFFSGSTSRLVESLPNWLKFINSESAKIQNTLIKESKTLSCSEFFGRLPYMFLAPISLLWDLQANAMLKLLLGSCSFIRCWKMNLLKSRTSALPRRCKSHTTVENTELWNSSPVRLLYRHSADHGPAGGVFQWGSLCQRSKMLISYAA